MTIIAKNPRACGSLNTQKVPANAITLNLTICCDSRRDECPYHLNIDHNNEEFNINFKQSICMFGHIRDY